MYTRKEAEAAAACVPQGKGAEGGSSRELFSGDGLPSKPAAGGSSKVYAGGARSQNVKVCCRCVMSCCCCVGVLLLCACAAAVCLCACSAAV